MHCTSLPVHGLHTEVYANCGDVCRIKLVIAVPLQKRGLSHAWPPDHHDSESVIVVYIHGGGGVFHADKQ